MIRRVAVGTIAVTLGLTTGCGKDGSGAKEKAEAPQNKQISDLFTGSAPTLPEVYGTLKLGAPSSELAAAVPGIDGEALRSEEYGEIFFVYVEEGIVTNAHFFMETEGAQAMVEAKWGAPVEAEVLGETRSLWFNPEAGIKFSLRPSGEQMSAEFARYTPLTGFLGDGPGLAFESEAPLIGLSAADLKAKYGDLVYSAEGVWQLRYPPTKWDIGYLSVDLEMGTDMVVHSFGFDLAYEAHPEDKKVLEKMFEAKWGAPTEEEEWGTKILVYSRDPRITVKDEPIFGEWSVSVEPADPGE